MSSLLSFVTRAVGMGALIVFLAAPAFAQSPTRTRIITASPSPAGQPTTLTAEVDALVGGGAPTGTIYFDDGVTGVGFAFLSVRGAGQATLTAGELHSCALTSTGGVKCWGDNTFGQLGDGTKTSRSTPVSVAGLTTGVVAVTAGAAHTCSLDVFGGVKCWGANYEGRLGDGTRLERVTPVAVISLGSGVVAIAAGYYHTCALIADGSIKCWGDNSHGQLGNGEVSSRPTPSAVGGPRTAYTALAAGRMHTCALDAHGGVMCWGDNYFGQTGDGGYVGGRTRPVSVVGLSSGVVAVAAGHSHSCAVTVAGALECWGHDGTIANGGNHRIPVQIPGLESGVVAASAGSGHTCVLLSSGAAQCWGENGSGQLGDGTTAKRLTPAPVSNVGGFAVALTSGSSHSCALLSPSRVLRCWGNNRFRQIGDGTTTDRLFPTSTESFSGILRARARRDSTLAAGWQFLRAAYQGDAGHSGSTGVVPHWVQ